MKKKMLRLGDGSIDPNKMSPEDIARVKEQTEEKHLNFTKLIEGIDVTSDGYKVLMILGSNELVYIDGEFYIGDTFNSNNKKKITKKHAQQIFVDYYVKHHINTDIKEKVKDKSVDKKEIVKSKNKDEQEDLIPKSIKAKKEEKTSTIDEDLELR